MKRVYSIVRVYILSVVDRGTGTPKDRDEVNGREFCVCDWCVCVLRAMGAPSIFKLMCKLFLF